MYKNRHQTRDILLIKKGTIVKINTLKYEILCKYSHLFRTSEFYGSKTVDKRCNHIH